jgi:hypothetical protein
MAVVIMICVYHLLEVRLGPDLWDTRLWMSGDLGFLMTKLLGTLISLSLSHISIPTKNNCLHKVLQLACLDAPSKYTNMIYFF